jgi:hypothetical protein
LAWAPSGGAWNWRGADHEIRPGDRIALVATRSGLARLLRSTRGSAASPPVSRLPHGLPSQRGKDFLTREPPLDQVQ